MNLARILPGPFLGWGLGTTPETHKVSSQLGVTRPPWYGWGCPQLRALLGVAQPPPGDSASHPGL